jgi:glycosyltransferase involved in cell wall biosynthesis
MNTEVTVLIPTFNRALALERALESLCNQTMKNFEVIVSDNCSTDNTEAILSKYRNQLRLTILRSDENNGPIANWKRGLTAVKTEWVKVLWSDDWLEPTALMDMVDFVKQNNIVAVLCGSFGHLPEGTELWVSEGFNSLGWNEIFPKLIRGELSASASTALIHTSSAKEALNTMILDPLAYQTAIGPDFQLLYWEIAAGGKVGYIPKPLVNLFASGDSISVVLGKQLRPLYAHTMLQVAKHFGLIVEKNDEKILNHWIMEGVVLGRVPNLKDTPGKFSFRIALSNWPSRGAKLIKRKLKGYFESKR